MMNFFKNLVKRSSEPVSDDRIQRFHIDRGGVFFFLTVRN